MNAAPILAALLALAPHPPAHPLPGWTETETAYRARLASIADDVAAVARTRTEAAILLGIADHEAHFAADVDAGNCYRGRGWERRCDGGRAVSIWQLQDADPERRETYRTNRRAAATEALRRALASVRGCATNAPTERLARYAGGRCDGSLARVRARELDASVRRALRAVEAVKD